MATSFPPVKQQQQGRAGGEKTTAGSIGGREVGKNGRERNARVKYRPRIGTRDFGDQKEASSFCVLSSNETQKHREVGKKRGPATTLGNKRDQSE